MTTLDLVLVWVAAACQTAFVVLWATLPFWREWIGRALMVKSASLAVYLDFSLAAYYWHLWESPFWPTVLFGLITLGIVSQLIALVFEMLRRRRRVAA